MVITVTTQEVLEKGCVDVDEALRILGCGKTTLYRMIKNKVMPCLRVNSGKRIPLAAIEKYVDLRLTQAPKPT